MDEINKNGCEKDFGLEKKIGIHVVVRFLDFILKRMVEEKVRQQFKGIRNVPTLCLKHYIASYDSTT